MFKQKSLPVLIFLGLWFGVCLIAGCAPEDEKTPYKKGKELESKGMLDEAMKQYSEQVKLDPNNALGYYGKGRIYGQKGFAEDAIKQYDKAIQRDPKMADAYQMRAIAHFAKYNYAQSWEDIVKAKELGVFLDQTFISLLRDESPKKYHREI